MTTTSPIPTASRPARGGTLTGVYVGAGLLLIGLNLRIGVASVSPVLAAIERGLGVSPATASLLTTIPVFAFGAFAFLTPTLTRLVGLHRLLGLTMAAAAIGIAVRMIPSPGALFGGTILVGAAIAVGNVCMPAVIKQDFAHRVGLMMGLYTTVLFVGAALASAFTVPLLTAFGGSWRTALGFWAIPAVAAFLLWLPRAIRGAGTRTPAPVATARGDSSSDPSTAETASAPSSAAPSAPAPAAPDALVVPRDEPRLARLFRDPVAWSVTAFMGLQSLSYYSALTWIPTLLQDAGVTAHEAGVLLSYSAFPGVAAALVVPGLLTRVRPRWLLVALAGLLCAVGFLGLLVAPSGAPAWLWMTLLGLGQGAAIALSLSYIVLRSPDARHTGHVSTMAQGTGYLFAGLGPLGIGVLHSATGGWALPLTVLIALLVVQSLAGAAASRDRHVLSRG